MSDFEILDKDGEPLFSDSEPLSVCEISSDEEEKPVIELVEHKKIKIIMNKISPWKLENFDKAFIKHYEIWILGCYGNSRLVQLPQIIKKHHQQANCRDYYYIRCLERIIFKNPTIVPKMENDKKDSDQMINQRAHLKFYKYFPIDGTKIEGCKTYYNYDL